MIIKETVNKNNSISGILFPDKTIPIKNIINKMGIIILDIFLIGLNKKMELKKKKIENL